MRMVVLLVLALLSSGCVLPEPASHTIPASPRPTCPDGRLYGIRGTVVDEAGASIHGVYVNFWWGARGDAGKAEEVVGTNGTGGYKFCAFRKDQQFTLLFEKTGHVSQRVQSAWESEPKVVDVKLKTAAVSPSPTF